MSTPLRDSKWPVGVMFFALGFGVLVLSLNHIASRMDGLHADGHAAREWQKNAATAANPSAPLADQRDTTTASGDADTATDLDTSE